MDKFDDNGEFSAGPGANTIPAVAKTIGIIMELARDDGALSRAELAERFGLSTSTAYRIMRTLSEAEWVRKTTGGRYELAESPGVMAALFDRRCERLKNAEPLLGELAADLRLAAKISVRRDTEQITLIGAASPLPIAVASRIGAVYPVIEGSVGAALLADCGEKQQDELIRRCAPRLPDNTDAASLAERIRHIREFGYCFNPGKGRWRVGAFSVPVRDGSEHIIAALTLLGHPDDFAADRRLDMLRRLRRCAAAVSSVYSSI